MLRNVYVDLPCSGTCGSDPYEEKITTHIVRYDQGNGYVLMQCRECYADRDWELTEYKAALETEDIE